MHGIFSRTVRLSRTQGAPPPPASVGAAALGPPSMVTPQKEGARKKHSCTPQKDGTPSPTGSTCSLVGTLGIILKSKALNGSDLSNP